MEEFELYIDQDLLNPNFENDVESPNPVWKLYARVNGQLYEYTKTFWFTHTEADQAKGTIGLSVTSGSDLKEDWKLL